MTFASEGVGKGAEVRILNGDAVLASGHVPKTYFVPAGNGEQTPVACISLVKKLPGFARPSGADAAEAPDDVSVAR